jgi:lipopolysaccharide export LptBFGC system permease protein LptF
MKGRTNLVLLATAFLVLSGAVSMLWGLLIVVIGLIGWQGGDGPTDWGRLLPVTGCFVMLGAFLIAIAMTWRREALK